LDIDTLGWNDFFASRFAEYSNGQHIPARVGSENRGIYFLYTAEYGEIWGEITGRLRHTAVGRDELPAVGDWVVTNILPDEGKGLIHAVLPRQSKFSRKVAGLTSEEQIVAANIDTVFLVTSLNRDFNLSRMERYLIMTWDSGANPVIVLNKADLCPDPTPYLQGLEKIAAGVPAIVVSCYTEDGLGELEPYLVKGKTVALLGSSGVGKSTLVNRLFGQDVLETQAIRTDDDRGRHTTTTRELLLLPNRGMIIDTPGMREMQLWNEEDRLGDTFEEIETLALDCRFRDCQHTNEPDCAVRAAIEDGRLDARRLESYHKLQRELAYQAARQVQKASVIERNRWKQIAKVARSRGK
jgi:ribosome biogenesis GTPase